MNPMSFFALGEKLSETIGHLNIDYYLMKRVEHTVLTGPNYQLPGKKYYQAELLCSTENVLEFFDVKTSEKLTKNPSSYGNGIL